MFRGRRSWIAAGAALAIAAAVVGEVSAQPAGPTANTGTGTGTAASTPQPNFAAFANVSSIAPNATPPPVNVTLTWTDTKNGASSYMVRRVLNSTGVTATAPGTAALGPATTPVMIAVPKGKFSIVDMTAAGGNSYDYTLWTVTKGKLDPPPGNPIATQANFKVLPPTATAVVPLGRNALDSSVWKDLTSGSWLIDTDGTFLQSDDNSATPQTSKRLVRTGPVIDNTSPAVTITPAGTGGTPPAITSVVVQVTASVRLTGWDKLISGANALKVDPKFTIGVGFANPASDWGGFFVLYGDKTNSQYLRMEDPKGNQLPMTVKPGYAAKDGTKFMMKLRMETLDGKTTHLQGKVWDPSGVQTSSWTLEADAAAWPATPFTIQPTLYGGVEAAGDGRVTVNFDDFLVEVFNSTPISTASVPTSPVPPLPTVVSTLIPPQLDDEAQIPLAAIAPVPVLGRFGTMILRVDPERPIAVNAISTPCPWSVPTAAGSPCCGTSTRLIGTRLPWTTTIENAPVGVPFTIPAAGDFSPMFDSASTVIENLPRQYSASPPEVGRAPARRDHVKRMSFVPDDEPPATVAPASTAIVLQGPSDTNDTPPAPTTPASPATSVDDNASTHAPDRNPPVRDMLQPEEATAADTILGLLLKGLPDHKAIANDARPLDQFKALLPPKNDEQNEKVKNICTFLLLELRKPNIPNDQRQICTKRLRELVPGAAVNPDTTLRNTVADKMTLRALRDYGAVATAPDAPGRDEDGLTLQERREIRRFEENASKDFKKKNPTLDLDKSVDARGTFLNDVIQKLDGSALPERLRMAVLKHFARSGTTMGSNDLTPQERSAARIFEENAFADFSDLHKSEHPETSVESRAKFLDFIIQRLDSSALPEKLRLSIVKQMTRYVITGGSFAGFAASEARAGASPILAPIASPRAGLGGGGAGAAEEKREPRDAVSFLPRISVIPFGPSSGSDALSDDDSSTSQRSRAELDQLFDGSQDRDIARHGRVWTYHFDHPARFPTVKYGANWCATEGEGAVIHEGMRLLARQDGQYELRFNITAPSIPVGLRLQLILYLVGRPDSSVGQPIPRTLTIPPIVLQPTGAAAFPNDLEGGVNPTTYLVSVRGYSQVIREAQWDPSGKAHLLLVKRNGTARIGNGVQYQATQ